MSDATHAVDTSLSENHHGSSLDNLWIIKSKSHEALLSRIQGMALDLFHFKLILVQRLISFSKLNTFLIYSNCCC